MGNKRPFSAIPSSTSGFKRRFSQAPGQTTKAPRVSRLGLRFQGQLLKLLLPPSISPLEQAWKANRLASPTQSLTTGDESWKSPQLVMDELVQEAARVLGPEKARNYHESFPYLAQPSNKNERSLLEATARLSLARPSTGAPRARHPRACTQE